MCLLTTQQVPQIAEEDIICYKVISPDMTSLYYTEFKWELGKLYETEIECCSKWVFTEVSQAFHSYKSLLDLMYGYFKSLSPCMMVKCTIPKGSEYYLGKQGEMDGYASNKIIVNEILDVKKVFNRFDWDNYPYKVGQKVVPNKGGTIYQILNIQPDIDNQGRADLIVENCISSTYEVIRTEYHNRTWIASNNTGVNVKLEILEENQKD